MNPLPTMIEFVGITSHAIHVDNHTLQSMISHAKLEHQTHEAFIKSTCEDVMWLTNLWDNTPYMVGPTYDGIEFFWLLDVTTVNMWKMHQEICMVKALDFRFAFGI